MTLDMGINEKNFRNKNGMKGTDQKFQNVGRLKCNLTKKKNKNFY